jgi:hypothetical protein
MAVPRFERRASSVREAESAGDDSVIATVILGIPVYRDL